MRKILNEAHENWLYENYRDFSNEYLAEKLTEMVRADNKKDIERLTALLPNVTDARIKKEIERNLASLKMFDHLTAEYVRRYARKLGCPKKSMKLKSETARQKALATNIKKWQAKAKAVSSPIEWFRSFYVNEVKICTITNKRELNSIRAAMSAWNRQEGFPKGIYLMSKFFESANLLRVQATINRSTDRL